ncbi:MAG: TonB family protein [Flavipsychrobacter sp.]
MKSLLLFITCSLSCLQLSAQTKILKIKDPNLKKTYESFTVLQFNPDVKEGDYKHIIDGRLATEGNYHENKRGGLWKWYNKKGEAESMVNYNTGIIHYPVKNGFMVNWYDESLVYEKDRSVIKLTSDDIIYSIIAKYLRYPATARESGIQGKVVIGIAVNSLGTITGYRIATSVDTSLDNVALNIVKLLPFDFIPAYKKGQAVDDEYLLPVGFQLR